MLSSVGKHAISDVYYYYRHYYYYERRRDTLLRDTGYCSCFYCLAQQTEATSPADKQHQVPV